MERDHLGVDVTGIEALMEAFDAVGAIGAKSAMQAAARKAVRPIAEEARRLAHRSGDAEGLALADSIVVRTTLPKSQKRKRGGRKHPVEVFVIATAPHAHLVEFGHRIVKKVRSRYGRVRSSRVVGHAPAYPFMRPAFDAQKRTALQIFGADIGTRVERVAKRYARQAERGKLSRGARKAFKVDI